MHADLLVFLAAAWLGPALAEGRRALRDPSQAVAGVALAVAGLAAGSAASVHWILASAALAFAAVLLALGVGLAREGRRASLRRMAIAGVAGAIAVLARSVLDQQAPASAFAGVWLPAALLLLLLPAAAALDHRLREHDLGARPPLGLRRMASTAILALALMPVLRSLPGSPW